MIEPVDNTRKTVAAAATSNTRTRLLGDMWSAFFLVYLVMLNLGDVKLINKPDGGNIGEALRINQVGPVLGDLLYMLMVCIWSRKYPISLHQLRLFEYVTCTGL